MCSACDEACAVFGAGGSVRGVARAAMSAASFWEASVAASAGVADARLGNAPVTRSSSSIASRDSERAAARGTLAGARFAASAAASTAASRRMLADAAPAGSSARSKSNVNVSFSAASKSSMTSRIDRCRSDARLASIRMIVFESCGGMICAGFNSGTGSSSARFTSKRG
jgi:hypothetical protein